MSEHQSELHDKDPIRKGFFQTPGDVEKSMSEPINKLYNKEIPINETFETVQGEGRLVGVPSLFIRTDGCNRKCQWGETKCDAWYSSWEPDGKKQDLKSLVDLYASYEHNHIVITGGEPMMWDVLKDLIFALKSAGSILDRIPHITIETNGTFFLFTEADLLSISPKLSSSVPTESSHARGHNKRRLNYKVLQRLIDAYDYYLKFVVDTKDDMEEIYEIVEELNVPADNVYLMAQGVDAKLLQEKAQWITQLCMDNGYRFTPRLHIDVWGNVRGT